MTINDNENTIIDEMLVRGGGGVTNVIRWQTFNRKSGVL